MTPLALADVLDLVAYERVRERMRAEVIAHKARRRVALGDRLTLLFEDRRTVLFQVQEMVRTERIVGEDRIQDELDAYNALLPGPGELSATLFIEIPEIVRMTADEMRQAVNRFQGIERALSLHAGGHVLRARFEGGHSKEEKMAAVQFVRFAVPEAARAALAEGAPARLVVDHPDYAADVSVSTELRAEMVSDLADA
ncbi:MAG TPA: DUF3501 family protein [Vicinamibacteria bacterium]|jgi:hypothetical protein